MQVTSSRDGKGLRPSGSGEGVSDVEWQLNRRFLKVRSSFRSCGERRDSPPALHLGVVSCCPLLLEDVREFGTRGFVSPLAALFAPSSFS